MVGRMVLEKPEEARVKLELTMSVEDWKSLASDIKEIPGWPNQEDRPSKWFREAILELVEKVGREMAFYVDF